MEDKNIFILYEDLMKTKRLSNTELCVILDLTQYEDIDSVKKFLKKASKKIISKGVIIKKFLFISYYYKEIFDFLSDMKIYSFVSFVDEEEHREEISDLKDEDKEHIVGINSVNSGVGIVFYKVIGIKNIIIESPLLNDEQNLKMLKELGYNNLFTIPNIKLYSDIIDSNWIRPEGITLYKNVIPNYILYFSEKNNIDTVITAYLREKWLGKVGDMLITIKDDDILNNTTNILPYTFDIRRMNCRAECHNCIKCERDIDYINRITRKSKKEDE